MYIDFPHIDPVALAIGPLKIHWYGIAYSLSLILGWQYCKWLQVKYPLKGLGGDSIDQFITYMVMGILLGGRLGFVLFYEPNYYWEHPFEILAVWHGGMSFHGALVGVGVGMYVFSRIHQVYFWSLTDVISASVPLGLFFGRIANFINDELYGRVTTVPWAVKFPNGGYLPRHPSQLYEALSEGLLLFFILGQLMKNQNIRQKSGVITALFLLGYGVSRCMVEFFREPTTDSWGWVTRGHLLSLPMFIVGAYVLYRRWKYDES